MGLLGLKLLKIAAAAVALVGLAAVGIVVMPVVLGQSLRVQPFAELRTHMLGVDIGVSVRDVDATDVKRERLQTSAGVIVDEVRSDGPAAKAGFKAGEVVVSFDGEKVRSARHFARLVEETPEGRTVEAVVVRSGEKVTLKVAPQATDFSTSVRRSLEQPLRRLRSLDFPRQFAFSAPSMNRDTHDWSGRLLTRSRGRLGAVVQDLTAQLGDYFGTRDGVLVTSVEEGTPAKAAGLKAGDVITKINGQTVHDTAELRRRWDFASTEVTVTIVRDHKELTLTSKIEGSGS